MPLAYPYSQDEATENYLLQHTQHRKKYKEIDVPTTTSIITFSQKTRKRSLIYFRKPIFLSTKFDFLEYFAPVYRDGLKGRHVTLC